MRTLQDFLEFELAIAASIGVLIRERIGRLFDPLSQCRFKIHDAADFIRYLAVYLVAPTTAL